MSELAVALVLLAIVVLGVVRIATAPDSDDGRTTDAPGLTRGYGCC